MNVPKQQRETVQIELVETYNLYRSLMRLRDFPGYQDRCDKWRRALYHALGMAGIEQHRIEKIRQALELP